MKKSIHRKESLKRKTTAAKCDCGGYAEKVECTKEEIKRQTCGRSYACCIAAFECCLCKQRFTHPLESPDYA